MLTPEENEVLDALKEIPVDIDPALAPAVSSLSSQIHQQHARFSYQQGPGSAPQGRPLTAEEVEQAIKIFTKVAMHVGQKKEKGDQLKFSTPAFKCLADYELCIKNVQKWQCAAVLIAAIARLLMPFAKAA